MEDEGLRTRLRWSAAPYREDEGSPNFTHRAVATGGIVIRDRVVELRRVRARDLLPNPKNWRKHPEVQAGALRAMLEDIGYADALLVRETPVGLMLIDGHLRAETTPDEEVPVLVLDVSDAEADKLLATLDPLAGMAVADGEALARLLEGAEIARTCAATLSPSTAKGSSGKTAPATAISLPGRPHQGDRHHGSNGPGKLDPDRPPVVCLLKTRLLRL